jgi:8-oxo-dGTP pyrophosphatase MutT (NUDIX family)
VNEPILRRSEVAGGVVVNEKGEVLVVSQFGTSWSLPKGHLAPGEEHLQAAVREIREEAGIADAQLLAELGSYERHAITPAGGEDRSEMKRITLFLFRARDRVPVPEDPENPEARWMSPEQAVALLTHPKDRDFLSAVLPTVREVAFR